MLSVIEWIAEDWWRIAALGALTAAAYLYLIIRGIRDIMANREEIACVAIKYPDIGWLALPAPARHHHVMWARLFIDGKKTAGEAIQGFLTTHRRFVNREQALKIATERGQIVKKHGSDHELYSEDMWDTPREAWGYTVDWLGYPDEG